MIDAETMRLGAYIAAKHERFVPFAFNILKDSEFIQTPFDNIINQTLDKTFTGEIKRLIINLPPRHGKTLRAIQAYVSRGFALNNASNFIHASYSEVLVHDNSVAIRDIIKHPDYQTLYPHVVFKQDTKSKGLWRTSAGGSFLASPSGGSVTGFGAGIMGSDIFSGALLIDDPVKPDDASSEALMRFINRRWENTFKSRLADQNVPVIVIMQRIAENDFTAELIEGSGSDEDWHHLILPAYIEKEYEYTQGAKLIEHNLPVGPLWPLKFSEQQAKAAMSNIQWSQEPSPATGEVYEREWFNRYDGTKPIPNVKKWSIYADTATKIARRNDYSVFQLWATTTSNHGYLVSQWRDKVKVPFLLGNLERFYKSAKKISNGAPVSISIEDKDSGQGLIQAAELEGYKVTYISRSEGKYARAVQAAPSVLHGKIYIPYGTIGDGLINEAVKFKQDDSHLHDDQIDPMNDYINYELPKISSVAPIIMAGGY